MTEEEAEATRSVEGDVNPSGEAADDSSAEGSATEDSSTGERSADDWSVDSAAESFVSLEVEFQDLTGSPDRLAGRAEDVDRIPAAEVPDGYPVTIESESALRLRVLPHDSAADRDDVDPHVYAAWPPDGDDPLGRLMTLRDIEPGQFADLHGERVPLGVEDGFFVLSVPPAGRRGSKLGVFGVVAGLLANLVTMALIAVGAGGAVSSLPVLVVLALLNFVVLPLGTYLDAWYLLTTTDWKGGPPFWATLAMLPGINVVSSLAYLYARSQAEPV